MASEQANIPGGPTEQASSGVVPTGGMAGDETPAGQRQNLHLGDELPPGAPGAGENICRICNGSGRLPSGEQCNTCGGTGKVIESVAGGP